MPMVDVWMFLVNLITSMGTFVVIKYSWMNKQTNGQNKRLLIK